MEKLKNYTTTISASTSMAMIEDALVQAGAIQINKQYNQEKLCSGIVFIIMVENMPLKFIIEAKIDACYKVLRAEISRPKPGTEERLRKQASMTAWKIWVDWVQVQLSLITLQKIEAFQVFLPYLYDESNQENFYERLKRNKFKQLTQ